MIADDNSGFAADRPDEAAINAVASLYQSRAHGVSLCPACYLEIHACKAAMDALNVYEILDCQVSSLQTVHSCLQTVW